MNKTRNLSFIVELLLLFVILLFAIVVITKTFMTARAKSEYARHLTEAVCLAEDVAEVSMTAADRSQALAAFEKMEQTKSVSNSDAGVFLIEMDFVSADGKTDSYRVEVTWNDEASHGGSYAAETIEVYSPETGNTEQTGPLYTLNTGSWHAGGDR